MASVDPELVLNMPKSLTAFGGLDALTHAKEAYVSVLATEFTNGLALEAIDLLISVVINTSSHWRNIMHIIMNYCICINNEYIL